MNTRTGKLLIRAAAAWLSAMALLWAGTAPPAGAQTIGRLFSSAQERVELDQIRNDPDFGKEEPEPVVETAVEAGETVPTIPAVTINGVVLRSDGQHVSWINGTRIGAGEATPDGIRVQTRETGGGRVRILLPGGPESVQLKPGQKIDILRGKLLEAYEIRIDEDAVSAFEETTPQEPVPAEETGGAVVTDGGGG